MSWNNYSSSEVLDVVDRHGGGSGGAGNGEVSATMTPGPRTPPTDRSPDGDSVGGVGVVSPDRSTTPLSRGFVVSPMNSLDRGGEGRGNY